MKYKRNSGRKKPVTKQEENTAIKQLGSDVEWVNELFTMNQFSSEWVHKVAVELLLQCMGKKEIVVSNGKESKLIRIFKEKPALEALGMIAKMNGHLFDVVKGTIKAQGTIEHEHKHEIELKPDANRTDGVLDILESCGAFTTPIKRLTKDDVEIISA